MQNITSKIKTSNNIRKETKDGLLKLEHLLSLDTSQIVPTQSIILDIYQVKKAIQSLKDEMVPKNEVNDSKLNSEDDSANNVRNYKEAFLYLFLCELCSVIHFHVTNSPSNSAASLQPG